MKKALLLLGMLVFSAVLFAQTATSPAVVPAVEERLLGVSVTEEKIVLAVFTTGGTKKEDFKVEVKIQDKVKVLLVTRIRRDDCKAMPSRMEIEFSLKELGLTMNDSLKFANAFMGNIDLAGVH